MREILFRGKREDNGEWVEGACVPDALEPTHGDMVSWGFIRRYNRDIGKMETIEVDRESVGQYTGLTDKNGKRVFEDDILKDSLGWVCEVRWENENGRFLGYHSKPRGDTYVCYVGREPKQEIIGNIHDNPELLEATL